MKKTLLFSALAAMALTLNAQELVPQFVRQQAPTVQKAVAAENTMEFAYCGEYAGSLGFGAKGTVRALMEVSATDAAKFAGAQISQVNVGIGSFGVNPKAQIIILSDLEGSEPVYAQEFTATQSDWNEVTLTTPYTIGQEGFFVGYQITASSSQNYPLGIDGETANPLGDWVGYLDGTKYEYMHLGSQGFGNNCIKLILSGDNLPQYDLALETLNVKEYIKTGAEFSVSGTVRNAASKSIQTYDVTLTIGDVFTKTITVNADELKNGKTHKFSIDGLSIEEDGLYDVTATVSNPNGNVDEYEPNNTLSKTITTLSTLVPRKVLLENFSTAQCGNCPRVHEMLNGILADRNDVAWVVHHSGFYTDEFTIADSESYMWFYGGGGTYAPATMLDRRCLGELGAEGSSGAATSPVFFPSSKAAVEEFIAYCLEQPAFISLNVSDVYNEETRELTIRVTGESSAELAKAPRINIFLTENGLVGYQSGGGNNYRHNHAIRKVLTSTWGDELTLEDNKFDVTYTYALDANWKPENMAVVAFVSDYNNKDYNACTVHNTEWKDLEYGASVSTITNDQCVVWTANKTISINGNYNNAAVYTIDGRLVKEANGKSYIAMDNAGVYIVVVDGVSHKVVIK